MTDNKAQTMDKCGKCKWFKQLLIMGNPLLGNIEYFNYFDGYCVNKKHIGDNRKTPFLVYGGASACFLYEDVGDQIQIGEQEVEGKTKMKVKKKITTYEEIELDITGATLLTTEEAKVLRDRLRTYHDWWWLRSPDYHSVKAAIAYKDGYGVVSDDDVAVRPILEIYNLESSNLKIGDRFEFGEKEFEVISNNKAFCTSDIGHHCFRTDWETSDTNDYEKSDVKKFIDEWFEKAKGKYTEEVDKSILDKYANSYARPNSNIIINNKIPIVKTANEEVKE